MLSFCKAMVVAFAFRTRPFCERATTFCEPCTGRRSPGRTRDRSHVWRASPNSLTCCSQRGTGALLCVQMTVPTAADSFRMLKSGPRPKSNCGCSARGTPSNAPCHTFFTSTSTASWHGCGGQRGVSRSGALQRRAPPVQRIAAHPAMTVPTRSSRTSWRSAVDVVVPGLQHCAARSACDRGDEALLHV